jgi:hypothetical protein
MSDKPDPSARNEFARQAEASDPGLLADMWAFMRHNKKWWLTPIILSIVVLGVLVVLSSTAAAPFIYALF